MEIKISFQKFSNFKFWLVIEAVADTRGKGVNEGARPPKNFTEALVLKSGSTRKFLFQ